MPLRQFDRVGHQHGDGQRADAARHRRYRRPRRAPTSSGCTSPTTVSPFRANSFGAAQARGLGGIRHAVDADVDHRRARRDEFGRDLARAGRSRPPEYPPAGTSPGDWPYASGKSSRWRSRAAASAPSACRRYRCARAPPRASFDGNPVILQHLDDPGGRAGARRGTPGHQVADVHGMKAVGVLVRRTRPPAPGAYPSASAGASAPESRRYRGGR